MSFTDFNGQGLPDREWQFEADMAAIQKAVAEAPVEQRDERYRHRIAEGARWHTHFGLEKLVVVDRFAEIASATGIETDTAQASIAWALEHPFDPVSKPKEAGWRGLVASAASLQNKDYPPVSYVIPRLVPEGLTLLAGKPKIGKSWMALDICLAVAAGRLCLGDRRPTQGDVLYCALEDNERRLKSRIGRIMGLSKDPWPERLTLTTQWRRLDKGGDTDIAEWMDSVAEPRLIVLDTLAGVRPIKTQTGYVEDYESLTAVHRLANDRGAAVLVLHHTRKMDADDPIDTVSGTLGLAGCADTVLVLNRTSKGTTLYVRGRDIEESEQAAEFNKENCRWTILGDAAAVHRSTERQEVLDALADGEMHIKDLIAATGRPRNNLEKLLHFMVKDGEVTRTKAATYAVTPGKIGTTVREEEA